VVARRSSGPVSRASQPVRGIARHTAARAGSRAFPALGVSSGPWYLSTRVLKAPVGSVADAGASARLTRLPTFCYRLHYDLANRDRR
jgi:hypothetical protein